MVRTQIQLTEQQARQLRKQAHEEHISVAEAIRRHIDRGIEAGKARGEELAAKYARAERFIGRYRPLGGESDLAENHDKYLNEGSRW